jgi:hypothetical protein
VMRDPKHAEDRARGVSRRLGARLVLAISVGALSIGALLWSCSGNNDAPPVGGETNTLPTASAAPLDCSVPNAGCPCTQPGEILKCGKVVYKSENYISCSIGLRTCEPDGTWTDCVGSQVVTLNSWQAGGLRLLSQPAPVSANNACDPNLFEIPSILAIDAGGITVLDSGAITLTQSGGGVVVSCADAGLAVTPGDASLQLTTLSTPPSPNSVQFQASLSGCAGDSGVGALWTVDQPGIATVNEGGLLSLAYPYAGPIHVTAYVGSLSGTATVNVGVNMVDTSQLVDAGVDAGGIAKAFLTTCGVDAGGGG